MKKILLVDDSALMRRVLCGIINSSGSFSVEDEAKNGVEALELLSTKNYDGVVLDVNMPKMDGIELLKELQSRHISARVLMASTMTSKGSQTTLDALELGALDFIHKPDWSFECRKDEFVNEFLRTLEAVCDSKIPQIAETVNKSEFAHFKEIVQKNNSKINGSKIVCIAVSTGGPNSLRSVIPLLPKNLNAPVVLVQHMPDGFTESFAKRLDSTSEIAVVEAREGDTVVPGNVYIAKAGMHLKLVSNGNTVRVHYSDENYREGVRPCANYMYESLIDSPYDQVIAVVMTGMGADGTEGIKRLKESGKSAYVITQDSESSVIYGMPRACVNAGLSDETVSLTKIAQEIILRVGVKSDGC